MVLQCILRGCGRKSNYQKKISYLGFLCLINIQSIYYGIYFMQKLFFE